MMTHKQILTNSWQNESEYREYWICHRCGNAEFVKIWNQRGTINTF